MEEQLLPLAVSGQDPLPYWGALTAGQEVADDGGLQVPKADHAPLVQVRDMEPDATP
jgi:hypothetical protein